MIEYFGLLCDEESGTVVLMAPGPRAIEVVTVLHRMTRLSLWHGKLLIRDVPAAVLDDVPEEVAAGFATVLREAGALVEVKRKQMSPEQS
ncbi:ribosomal protein L7/L12 [Streptomyces sp. NPDC048516]|uniref:ribosomal protein L7/L12 n=1 Tax=Streptomyces sp. NPDC048516 TaxID=3365565 RepID=UPI00371D588C